MLLNPKGLTVHKYEVPAADTFKLTLPEGAQVLAFQYQQRLGGVCLWAAVDPDAPVVAREFRLAGTGHPLLLPAMSQDVELDYVGTAQWAGVVFHLFEVLA